MKIKSNRILSNLFFYLFLGVIAWNILAPSQIASSVFGAFGFAYFWLFLLTILILLLCVAFMVTSKVVLSEVNQNVSLTKDEASILENVTKVYETVGKWKLWKQSVLFIMACALVYLNEEVLGGMCIIVFGLIIILKRFSLDNYNSLIEINKKF